MNDATDPTEDARLRDLLDSAAPDQPDLPPAARSTAVRERAVAVRRRSRLVLAAVVVAVVGIGVGVSVLTSGDDPNRATDVASDPPVVGEESPACPTESIDVSRGLKVTDLPDGATSARACLAAFDGGPGGVSAFESMSLPDDVLVDDLDAFTSAVRDLPAYSLESKCALSTPVIAPWVVVVSYPDGSSVPIGATTQYCAPVTVAGVDRSADEIVSLYYEALGKERTDPTGSGGIGASFSMTCPTDQAGIDATLADLNTYDGDVTDFEPDYAHVCYVPGDEREPAYTESEATVRPGDEQILGDDLTAGFTTEPQRAGRCEEDGPRRVLVLNDATNDTITLVENPCTGEFSGHGIFWLPGEQASGLLDEVLGEDYFFS